jgi:hypothetical protein
MNILRTLRKPYLSIAMATIFLVTSCTNYDNEEINNELNNKKLSLDIFDTLKGQLLNINNLSTLKTNSRLEQNNYILSQVNDIYDTNINFDDNLKDLDNAEDIFNWLKNNTVFNKNDIKILSNFSKNLTSKSFDNSVSILENEISDENVDSFKFKKYQSIVNGVALIEYQYAGLFTTEIENQQKSPSCAWAIAKLALASAALVTSCNPAAAAATVGTACYLAAASFIAASASVGIACGDKK